ncbi:unnamed protein product [Didymodactylos carnosus]|uniref:Uncharacterized protein n=1 Tax=Didymodactylos carnosus TaxID=1234261 RepID=A0A8S2UMF8_9BILA|nr:unnamed protein product [Didymodactylos carnosus]CAF4353514.1 unnamed protein product [Didymodactylos carnosus]
MDEAVTGQKPYGAIPAKEISRNLTRYGALTRQEEYKTSTAFILPFAVRYEARMQYLAWGGNFEDEHFVVKLSAFEYENGYSIEIVETSQIVAESLIVIKAVLL